MEHENAKVAAEAAAATQRARLEEERLRAENAAAVARQAVEAQRRQEELHEEFRRRRGSTIAAKLQALRLLRPERAAPLSPAHGPPELPGPGATGARARAAALSTAPSS